MCLVKVLLPWCISKVLGPVCSFSYNHNGPNEDNYNDCANASSYHGCSQSSSRRAITIWNNRIGCKWWKPSVIFYAYKIIFKQYIMLCFGLIQWLPQIIFTSTSIFDLVTFQLPLQASRFFLYVHLRVCDFNSWLLFLPESNCIWNYGKECLCFQANDIY